MQEQMDMIMWAIEAETPWLIPVAFGMFGACVGSFLNVVIYRMPRGLSINEPRRSYCPHCKKSIPWYLNIPIISWLMLRGKSACCQSSISVRYWLVEVACMLFFIGTGMILGHHAALSLPALGFICVWGAVMLATLCIDWERMEVLPPLTLIAAAAGVAAAVCEPQQIGMQADASDALLFALFHGAMGFVLLKMVALLGRLLFGKKRVEYEKEQPWTLRQADDDLELRIGNDSYSWCELFMENHNRLSLEKATITLPGKRPTGTIQFSPEHLTLPDGTTEALENHEQLEGTCTAMEVRREAMGSGDAWIALAIGALCGLEGVIFSLVIGSILGILWAIISKIGRGEPMPFGPVFITAAWIYLFFGHHLMQKTAAFVL